MKYLILAMISCSILSCSVKTSEAEPETVDPGSTKTSEPVGPFTVAFTPTQSVYEHSFRIPIDQDSGKVEYFVQTGRKETVIVEFVNSAVVGCPAAQVKHTVLWFDDETNMVRQVLKTNSQFSTKRNTKGRIIHAFENLNGCTEIEIKMRLRQNPHGGVVGTACTGYAKPEECKIEAYCREKYATNFIEIEVWNRGNNLTLQKFMNSGAGSRSMMSANSARFAVGNPQSAYTSTSSTPASLKFDNATLSGIYTERLMGQDFTNEVSCDL